MENKFIVITKTYFEPSEKKKILDLAERSFPIFRKQPGLIAIMSHISHDQSHTMSYLSWKDKRDHEACMVSKDFSDFNQEWEKLLSSGKVRFELQTYDLLGE